MAGWAEPLVLTLDIGTSSVRSLLFDARARAVEGAETHLPYRPTIAADGTAEVPFPLLERLCRQAIDATLVKAPAPAAVGVSSFWHGLLGLDNRLRPTTPVILWSDTRSWRQAVRLLERLDGERVRERTGCPVHPSYWPAKLALLRERQEVWERTRHWVSPADALFLHLLGELGTSPSMASGTGLRRLDGGWDGPLLEELGLEEERLPPEAVELRAPRSPAARRWPQLKDALWVCALGDGALANLGTGCTDERRRAATVGTSGALRVLTRRRPRLAPGLWCYLLDEQRRVVGGALSNGGNLYEWLLQTLRVDPERLEAELARMRPGQSRLDVLPLLAGERSPGFAPRATGAIVGLTLATRPQDIVQATLEGVALTFAAVDQALDRTVPGARRLVASGGGLLHSPTWMQMVADAVGKPVAVVTGAAEASSHGAALYALERLGIRAATDFAVERTFEPRASARAAYQEALLRQERLYRMLIEGRN